MTRLANDIREAGKPIYCSACFNQQDIPHVDFDAANDRGTKAYSDGVAVDVAMDDLILCANCVKTGAGLLGMTDDQQLHDQLEDLTRKLDSQRKRAEKAERYADTLEDALGTQRAQPVHVDHRKKPREKVAA